MHRDCIMRILIVGDDDDTRDVFREASAIASGWTLLGARTGSEALSRANLQRYEAVFISAALPDIPTSQVLVELRRSLSAASRKYVITAESDRLKSFVGCGATECVSTLSVGTVLRTLNAADRTSEPNPRLGRALRMLEIEGPLEARVLARSVGLSESRLRHLFKANIGVPLGRFLRDARLHRAAALLESTSQPVCQIAAQAQFTDPRSFSRAFYRRFKVSPSRYRGMNGRGVATAGIAYCTPQDEVNTLPASLGVDYGDPPDGDR